MPELGFDNFVKIRKLLKDIRSEVGAVRFALERSTIVSRDVTDSNPALVAGTNLAYIDWDITDIEIFLPGDECAESIKN